MKKNEAMKETMSVDEDVKNTTVWKKMDEATKEPMSDKIKLTRKHQYNVQNTSNKFASLSMVNSEIKIMSRTAKLLLDIVKFKVARSVTLER